MEVVGPRAALGLPEVPFPRATTGVSLNLHIAFFLVSFYGEVFFPFELEIFPFLLGKVSRPYLEVASPESPRYWWAGLEPWIFLIVGRAF